MVKVTVKNSISNKPKYVGMILALFGIIIIIMIIANSSSDKIVKNSQYDSSVHQVESYLGRTLLDPDSFEPISWSKVQEMKNSNDGYKYVVRLKYRAKNSFNGYVIESKLFYLDEKGTVVNVK